MLNKFIKKLFINNDSSTDIVCESAFDRRQRFIAEADENYGQIPIPDCALNEVRIAEIIPDNEFELGKVTWGIQTRKGEKFVFAKRWPNGDDERWIVTVKTRYFYAAWLSSRDQTGGMEGDPPYLEGLLDRNSWTDEDESKVWTLEKPVALPCIGGGFAERNDAHLQFVNGRHRTRWLIANGAAAILVEVFSKKAAYDLHSMMGLPGHAPETVKNLVKKNTSALV